MNSGPPTFQQNNPFGDKIQSAISSQFVENDLLKATNIYQQFDKKGNLFENRLYAKTSINQVKLAKDEMQYDKRMSMRAEELYRINNQALSQSGGGMNSIQNRMSPKGDERGMIDMSIN